MKKISLDELRSWKVKDYDETFCRYALKKIIDEYSRLKHDAEKYKRMYKTHRYEVDIILRHFKLCVNCFFGVGPRDWKKNKPKFVKGVYDRRCGSVIDPYSDQYFDAGWVCTKHREADLKLTRQLSPIANKLLGRMAKMIKEDNNAKQA